MFFRFGLLGGLGALLAFTVFLGLGRLSTIITMLVAATFFTLGLERPLRALTQRGMRRGTAVALLSTIVLVLVVSVTVLVVPKLAHQIHDLLSGLPRNEATKVLTPHNIATLATGLLGAIVSVGGAIFFGLTTIALTLFLLGGWTRVLDGAYRFVPATRRDRVRRLGDAMMDKVGAHIVGALTIAACAATAAFLWSWLTGVPYPLVMAAVVGFFDLIPQVGATLGSTIVILTALTVSLPLALATLVFFCAYQGLENWVTYPRLMSRAVKITNLAAITSAMVGGALYGILGILIAVPLYAGLQLLVREVVFPRQDSL